MKPDEFKRQINDLAEDVRQACYYYAIWKALSYAEDEKVHKMGKVLNQYRQFFTWVRQALNRALLLDFAKIFDKDIRSLSLVNLLETALSEPILVPHATQKDIQDMQARLLQHQGCIDSLKTIRDQYVAHSDISVMGHSAPLVPAFESCVDTVKNVLNDLSCAHDRSIYAWEQVPGGCEKETNEILRLVEQEMTQLEQRWEKFSPTG